MTDGLPAHGAAEESLSVLLVEDNPADARLMRETLREIPSIHFDLAHAQAIGESLRLLAEKSFDVVLLDLSLPDSLGLTSFTQVHAQAPRIPIIVLSGLNDERVALEAVRKGAQDYLVKGEVDEKAFSRIIRYAIERKRVERELEKANQELRQEIEERGRMERKMVESEKMAAVGKLAAGIAHEINNPLGVILGFAQGALSRGGLPDLLRHALNSIERESLRCRDLVRDLLTFARSSKGDFETVDLNDAVEQALSLVATRAKMTHVQVERRYAAEAGRIQGNRIQLQQVILNLSHNAIDAMPTGGRLLVETFLFQDGSQRWSGLSVQDSGCGIPEDIQSRVFEPFFTTKDVGKGTGLGLSLAYEVTQRHGGSIEFRSRPGDTRFLLKFPPPPESGTGRGVRAA